jgi:uncharacterized Zn finger protein
MAYFEDGYPEYVPVAERRAKAERKFAQLRKKNPKLKPIIIEGRALATTWWGKSWNSNLERYADYKYRLERGRSYARYRSVLDLQLSPGKVTALVLGSSSQPYKINIKIDQLSASNWAAIRTACEGRFDSLGELLAGKFPNALKNLFFEEGAGLFPTPREIHFSCSCPDAASMCKHVAASLYGVGARFDEDSSLFFTLRGINIEEIISETISETTQTLLRKSKSQSGNVLEDVDLGAVFGIELDDVDVPLPDLPPVKTKASTTKKKATKAQKTSSTKLRKQAVAALPPTQKGTMLDALVKAAGKARKGKSVDQLQDKLGWTKTQVRNTITRASAKELIEPVKPGVYRQKV